MKGNAASFPFGKGRVYARLEALMWLVAMSAMTYAGTAWWEMHAASSIRVHSAKPAETAGFATVSENKAAPAAIIGSIEIPDLHLAAPITNGIGRVELIRGVGHIPGSALPGGLGTMALAGHRDTFFRGLSRVQIGMIIRVHGEGGHYRYQVNATQVVTPEQVDVLNIGSDPSLVLITCYPFTYIGAAPKRFIVHARLISVAPDPDGE